MATLSSSLVKKLVSVTNDSSSTATSSNTAYGTVSVSGNNTYVMIDGGTILTPVVAGADARDQDRVIVTIENHTATITSNLTNPASSYTATETQEEITNYLNDESEDGHLALVSAYIGDLTVDTAYIDTLLANYATIEYIEGEYLSYVEGYIGSLTSDSIVVTQLLANYATVEYLTGDYLEYVEGYIGTLTSDYATIDYLTGDYLEYVDGRISSLTSDYITTEYLTTNYLTASTIDSQYANIELLNVSTESVKNLFVTVGVLTEATIEDAYITGMLNGVRINADVITAGTLSVDRLLVTGEDSIVYQINVNSSGLSMTELSDEVYQNYLNGTDIVANSITATQIAAGTITANEINTTSLAASEAFLTTLTAQTAFIDAIETNTVVVGAVETAEAAIADQEILYTTTSSATTSPDSSAVWSTVQPDRVSGVYIWMKIVNTYGNGTTYTSTPVCISGLDGEDGISGASVAISASTVSYAVSTSGSTVPTSGWTTTLPTASNGQYLWTRTEITYELTDADGNTTSKTTTSYGVSYIGIDGTNGTNGTDGTSVSISSSAITYCASTSGTTVPSGTWSSSVPSVSNGQYLWTRTVVKYSTGDTTTSYSVSYIGIDGEDGTDGISISSVTNYYALSTSSSTSPTSWSTSVQTMTLTNRYLWNYETKYYSDGSSDSTTPHVIGVYGATGAAGEDGVGIADIAEYYAVSSSSSTAPTTWYTTLQTMTVTYKYLWNYETVTYTNGTTEDSIARVIGVYGNTGAKGDTGDAGADGSSVTIYSTEISYIASSSGTTVPSGTWSSSIPSVSNGQYLWTRTVVVYYLTASDGTLTTETTTSYSVAYIGKNGTNGEDGTSVSIASTTISYCVSSSGTTTPSGTWSTSVPSVSQGQYLWTRTVVTYSTGDTTTSYGVSYIGTDGQDGKDGADGQDGSDGEDGTTLYATCSTAAATAAKVATITPTKSDFELTTGTTVSVKFSYTNTASSSTLNVNSTGAYSIYYKGAAITASYIVASMTLTFCFNGSQWEYTGYVNTDTYDRTRFNGAVKASAAIASGNIIVGNSSGYHQLNAGTSFDISYPILYAGSSISSGSTGTNNYTEINFTVTTTQSTTLTAYKYVYIKGSLSGTTFTPSSTSPLTQTVPTSSDGVYYICLGLAYSTTGIHLDSSHEIYMYYNGAFQSLGSSARQIVANWCYNNNTTYIDGGNIYAGTVTTNQLAANSVTAAKISVDTLSAITANLGDVTAGTLKSTNYVSGSAGVYIDLTNGTGQFAGSICASSITALNSYYIHNSSGTKARALYSSDGNVGSTLMVGDGFSSIYLEGYVFTSGDLYVYEDGTGDLTCGNIYSGTASLTSKLSVAGATTLSSSLTVSGQTTLKSTLDVTSVTTLSSTLTVSGTTSLNSTLSVTGATTLSSTLTVNGVPTVSHSSGDTYWRATRTDTDVTVSFGVGSGGTNNGVFSNTLGIWMIYSNGTYVRTNAYCYNYDGSYRYAIGSGSSDGQRVSAIQSKSGGLGVYGQYGTTGSTYAGYTVSVSSSDVRLKTNIQECEVNAMSIIQKIHMHQFDWINRTEDIHQDIGMIADELELIDSRFAVGGGYDDEGNMDVKCVDTFYLVGYIVKALQELDDKVTILAAEIEVLQAQLLS